jgi:hypothetical protein
MKPLTLPAGLLLAGAIHNQAHKWADPADSAMVWNATGAGLALFLLCCVAWAHRDSAAVLLVCALLAGWAAQTAGCSVAWLIEPWELVEGGEICSDRLGVPLGALGCMAALLVAAHLYKRARTHD